MRTTLNILFLFLYISAYSQVDENSPDVKRMEEIRSQKTEISKELNSERIKNGALQRKINELENELFSKQRINKKHRIRSKLSLVKSEREKQNLLLQIAEMDKRDAFLSKKIEQLEGEKEQLQNKISELEQKITSLEAALLKANKSNDDLVDVILDKNKTISNLENKVNGFSYVLPSFKLRHQDKCRSIIDGSEIDGTIEMAKHKKWPYLNLSIMYYHNPFLGGRLDKIKGYILVYDNKYKYVTHTKKPLTLLHSGFEDNYQVFNLDISCVELRKPLKKGNVGSYIYVFVPERYYHYQEVITSPYISLCTKGVFLFTNKNNVNAMDCRKAILSTP